MLTLHPLSAPQVSHQRVAALLDGVFGPHPAQRSMLESWAHDPSRSVCVAVDNAEPVGVMVVRRMTSVEAHHAYGVPFGLDLATLGEGGPLGSLQVLAVAPSHRQQGLGLRLAHVQVSWLVEAGVRGLLGVAWVHGQAGNSARMFVSAGFTCLAERDDFYQELQRQSGQRCPRCGPGACGCVAQVYYLALPALGVALTRARRRR